MKILVTGGAGYIGSHMSRLLLDEGHEVIVLDSLETGYRQAVPTEAEFVEGTTHNRSVLDKIFSTGKIEAVIHFAAYKAAGESVKLPGKYFYNNTAGTLTLLEAMVDAGVSRLVFSSTAAVYGNPKSLPANETLTIAPENPYGESKALVERMLPWYDKAHGLKSVMLRYFNVAGAWLDGSLGEDPRRVECLIPLVLQVAGGKRPDLNIFGQDYPTPDGTAIRDYIHVLDLAAGHLAALNYLSHGGKTEVINLGTGKGVSVQEVVDQAKAVTNRAIPLVYVDRRLGDPTEIWADNKKAREILKWQPKYILKDILETAWKWQQSHPDGFSQ
jgi:UDP-glucose 4-epimerase